MHPVLGLYVVGAGFWLWLLFRFFEWRTQTFANTLRSAA